MENTQKENKMMTRLSIVVAAIIVIAAGCNPIYTSYDYDKDADFERYQTYSWFVPTETMPKDAKEAAIKSPLMAKRIRSNIDEQLALKGLRLVEEGGDLFVFYHLGSEQMIQVQQTMYSGMDLWATSRVGGSMDNKEITQGAIIVDLLDAGAKQLVWRGIAENARAEDAPQEQINDTIDRAIKEIFKKYPPK